MNQLRLAQVAGVEKAKTRVAVKLILNSMLRLSILFAVMALLLWIGMVNVAGLIVGFTVVFVLIIFEGWRMAKSL